MQQCSVQFRCSVVSDSLWPHESQHAKPFCPLPTPGVYSNSCSLSRWCHPAISCSVIPFSSCPQSFPASESFPMSQLFFRMRWLKYWSFSFSISSSSEYPGLISLQSKGLSRVFSKAPHKLPHRHQIFYNIEEPKLWQNALMNKKTPSRGDWAQCFLRSSWLLLILKLRQSHVQNF